MEDKKFKVTHEILRLNGEFKPDELRKIAIHYVDIDDSEIAEIWEEKIKKDDINQVVEYLQNIGFRIKQL